MKTTPGSGRRLAAGTLTVLTAEALALPVALLLSAYVTRRLGPGTYGLYAIAGSMVAWVEWTAAAVISRAIIRETARHPGDDGVGTAAVQVNLLVGLAGTAALWLAAPALALLTGEPRLTHPLRLFALDVPLFTLAMAHRMLLVGTGAFSARAVLPVVRWVGRLALVTALVASGWSLDGVIVGCLAASALELTAARVAIHPPLVRGGRAYRSSLLADAAPFVLLSVMLRLFDRIDLLLFKIFGGSTADAGLYGAAQSLAASLSVVSVAFPPLLLATLTSLYASGDREHAAAMAARALRVVSWLLPLAGLVGGGGTALAGWLFGAAFAAAGPLLAPLVATAVAQVIMAVVIMVLTAAGRPNALVPTAIVMVLATVAAGAIVIPRYGAMGAALTTAAAGVSASAVALWMTRRLAAVALPLASLGRSGAAALVSAIACRGALGLMPVPAALACGGVCGLLSLAALGEFGATDLQALKRVFAMPGTPAGIQDAR